MESVEGVKGKKNGKERRFGKRYGFELKLRCVKLRLEEGLPVSLLSKEVGVSKDVVYRWVKAYQERGEAGLRNQVRSSGSRRKLPGAVREKINSVTSASELTAGSNLFPGPRRMSFNGASCKSLRKGFRKIFSGGT
jgi:transposase-like protein